MRLKTLCAAVLMTIATAGTASADSFFWAVNQFATVQKINGDTGAVVDSFAVPFLGGGCCNLGASIAVVGNIGYSTLLSESLIVP